jgi:heme/copper-type cytochrome/quinol oxidase subunit 2
MENIKTTAKDFFLHLGAIAGLYAVAIALVNLLFTVINEAYPAVAEQYIYGYYSGSSSISLPVATLIIIFPVFLLLSMFVYKTYETEPEKKQIGIRRWLTYITLFVAGVILAGDLVTVLYKFLDGQDLTLAFLLKALVVLLLTGCVFKFYLDEIRDKMAGNTRKIWVICSSVAILIAIILGFSVIGSPSTQRMIRYDNQKVSDLQNIQWQVVNYWQRKEILPTKIEDMIDPISGYSLPSDPQSGEMYVYRKTGLMSFELCAKFNKESNASTNQMTMMPAKRGEGFTENWMHGMGEKCFERIIDPLLYPVTKPVR